jgi:hypothetical protein
MTADKDIFEWQRVPERVAELLPAAAKVRVAHEKAALAADILPLTVATWMPAANVVTLWSHRPLSEKAAADYRERMADYGVTRRILQAELPPEDVIIKQGSSSLIPGYGKVWNTANSMLGGPNPMTNGIVSALILGGLGYGGGALAENLFPERYLERGKLRKSLATAGALGGLGFGAMNAYANSRAMNTSYLDGLFTDNRTVPPYMRDKVSFDRGPSPLMSMDSGLYAPTIKVPQFNQAAWADVNKGFYNPGGMHTPPNYAAVTTGMMSGISAGMNSPIIRPVDVIKGFVSAGVGLATANIAGKTLGALAGLTPAAQDKLQDMGLWAGMMHAVVPPLFGRR